VSQQDLRQLRAFALDILAEHTGSLDGCDIEEIAVKHGLLEERVVVEPCSENCDCALMQGFPAKCYFKTPLVTGSGRV